jgi:hypothetical protein
MTKALWAAISSLTHGMVLVGCESKFFKRFISAWKTMNSYLNAGRTAESGAGARPRRFVPQTGVVAQPEEFCLTPHWQFMLNSQVTIPASVVIVVAL